MSARQDWINLDGELAYSLDGDTITLTDTGVTVTLLDRDDADVREIMHGGASVGCVFEWQGAYIAVDDAGIERTAATEHGAVALLVAATV